MKKISKTFHVRKEALKLLYYLKADFMINNDEENDFWNQLFEHGCRKLEDLDKQGKTIALARIDHKRIATGAFVDNDLYNKLISIGKKNNLKKYEIIELVIYFYAMEYLNSREKEFFELEKWGIVIF
ncbi:hypothetical protein [Parageobacillus thermoglucosidasius]|uniref:Uncharacterized protein n=1 Tax=Parageobacillus thermoglucosidasius TaxID=1426 RepID=A0AB38R5V7_PARTM|nr:hypothetical protein [Parageobacillus thermoglucosidasius]UOE78372.1 hypothetical protein IMI45_20260 [Parageobacillus thermoglucosidasius]